MVSGFKALEEITGELVHYCVIFYVVYLYTCNFHKRFECKLFIASGLTNNRFF